MLALLSPYSSVACHRVGRAFATEHLHSWPAPTSPQTVSHCFYARETAKDRATLLLSYYLVGPKVAQGSLMLEEGEGEQERASPQKQIYT